MSAPTFSKPAAELFATDLPEECDENMLKEHFDRIDRTIRIRFIRVIRNPQTYKSRGMALIECLTPEDAEKAIQAFNYTEILGKEMNLAWYKQGGVRDRVTGNLFVKNLSADFKSKELHAIFAPFGKIISCKVKYDAKGACRGYGYVQFADKAASEKALSEINGKDFHGSKIEVVPFKARESRSSSITMYNNLFVKPVPKKFTNEDLKKLFEQYGEILSAVVIKERADAPENKGFGFVCYKKAEDAKLAEEKLKGFKLDGQPLYVCKALRIDEHKKKMREERYLRFKDCNLYVRDFPDETKDEDLKKAFEQFGTVISARVMMERYDDPTTGKTEFRSKHFGFVCMSTKEEAKKVLDTVASGKEILGRKLYVAICEKKEDRANKFTQGFMPMQMPMYPMPAPQYYHHARPRRMHQVIFSLLIFS